MKKVLFSILGTDIEVIQSARLINSYYTSNPNSEINILCYENTRTSCEVIKNVSNVYSIDSKKIRTYLSGEIYPDTLAINTFCKNIKATVDTKWDQVINLTNDNVSAYLISGLTAKEVIGSHIGNYGSVLTTNDWNTFLNAVTSKEKQRTISTSDVKSHMIQAPIDTEIEVVKVDHELALTATSNFNKIRSSKNNGQAIVVGISLTDGRYKEFIDNESLVELIDVLETSNEYRVVLISSGNDYERDTVNALNAEFNNTLITINAQTQAISAIMNNLDCLVSCSNTSLAIAQACDTFTIELINEGNNEISETQGNFVIETRETYVDDVFYLLNTKFETILPVSTTSTKNSVYETLRDDFGYFKSLVHGNVDINKELTYHLKRCYNYTLLGYPTNNELLRNLREQIPQETLMNYIEFNKEEITLYVKTLLTSLRSLKSTKETGQNTDKFIRSLDTLISSANDNTLPSGALGLLDGRIENITSTDIGENIAQIEKYLFELKSDLQLLTNIFGDLLSQSKQRTKNTNQEA